ncbi:MAG: glycosyltransferase family A protein [Terriglobales bacterium]
MPSLPAFVLITPARNEANFIQQTIDSVVAQTVRPLKWVIVSDGSTDGTDDIVRKYAESHPWIELLRMPERRERHFAGKVYAFNAGYARVKDLDYDVIGNLDADVTFDDPQYFAFLMNKFAENPRLGVGGTPYRQGDFMYNYRYANIEDVCGACQLFRRQCFEDIGGYSPVKGGGVDHIAFLTARMKGWPTQSFPEKVYLHHRPSGTAQRGQLAANFKTGAQDYALGSHPLWVLFRTGYQMTRKPYLIGGLTRGGGYFWALARRSEKVISPDLEAFRRGEQMQRLKKLFLPSQFVAVETTQPR